MSRPLLEVRDLHKHFPVGSRGLFGQPEQWLRAVDGVSLHLERGETLGLVGESGCGKSTVARTIIGLERATSGSVQLEGQELTGLSRRGWRPWPGGGRLAAGSPRGRRSGRCRGAAAGVRGGGCGVCERGEGVSSARRSRTARAILRQCGRKHGTVATSASASAATSVASDGGTCSASASCSARA